MGFRAFHLDQLFRRGIYRIMTRTSDGGRFYSHDAKVGGVQAALACQHHGTLLHLFIAYLGGAFHGYDLVEMYNPAVSWIVKETRFHRAYFVPSCRFEFHRHPPIELRPVIHSGFKPSLLVRASSNCECDRTHVIENYRRPRCPIAKIVIFVCARAEPFSVVSNPGILGSATGGTVEGHFGSDPGRSNVHIDCGITVPPGCKPMPVRLIDSHVFPRSSRVSIVLMADRTFHGFPEFRGAHSEQSDATFARRRAYLM